MLHYWSDDNKVTTEGLQIRYTTKYTGKVNGVWLDSTGYEYHKIVTKSYKYVGMDERTAMACAKDKLAKYTKERFFWYYEGGQLKFYRKKEQVANVTPVYVDGCTWQVEIQVNEDQVYYSFQWFDDPSGLFDGGDYDENEPSGNVLAIKNYYLLNASPYPYIYLDFYVETSKQFQPELFFVQYTANGTTWIDYDLPVEMIYWDQGKICLGTTKQVPLNAYKWRLQYYLDEDGENIIYSNYWIVPNSSPSYSNDLYLGKPYEKDGYICFDFQKDIQSYNPNNLELWESNDGSTYKQSEGYMILGDYIQTALNRIIKSTYWMLKYLDINSNVVYEYVPYSKTIIKRIDGTRTEVDVDGVIGWQGEQGQSEDNLIQEVVLGSTVTGIGSLAFSHCNELSTFQFSDNVETIGEMAFTYSKKLNNVVVPDSVTSIGEYAFEDCDGLRNITLSKSIQTISKYCFHNSGIIQIDIPDSVTKIDEDAFDSCTYLREVRIGGMVQSIEARAFGGCSSLDNITIPRNVKNIKESAFSGCQNLGSVSIETDLALIGDYVFLNCHPDLIVYVKNETMRTRVLNSNSGLRNDQVEVIA